MAIEVVIKQSGFFKKRIDLARFKQFIGDRFDYGVMNSAYVMMPLSDTSLKEQSLIVYNPQRIGRGFFFWTTDNEKACSVSLNVPSTTQDIIDFYDFIKNVCQTLSVDHFIQDENATSLSEIAELKNRTIEWNGEMLKQAVTDYDQRLIILGANNPISLDEEALSNMRQLDGATLTHYFEDYLHHKQRHDYYYAKPTFFQGQAGGIFGVYALTEGVASIVPIKPYITFNAGIDPNTEIEQWVVSLVTQSGDDFNVAGYVNYADLQRELDLENAPRYDREHAIVELNDGHIQALAPLFVDM